MFFSDKFHPQKGFSGYVCSLVSKFPSSFVDMCVLKFHCYVFLVSLNFIIWGFILTMKPETISKTLVNQMLLCFGVIFAAQVVECSNGLVFACFLLYLNVIDVSWIYISQDSSGMLVLLGIIEQCLKAGKKQSWHAASVTNICVGLLTGFKVLFILLWSTQSIFCGALSYNQDLLLLLRFCFLYVLNH